MKCFECGQTVGNLPAYAETASVQWRCGACKEKRDSETLVRLSPGGERYPSIQRDSIGMEVVA